MRIMMYVRIASAAARAAGLRWTRNWTTDMARGARLRVLAGGGATAALLVGFPVGDVMAWGAGHSAGGTPMPKGHVPRPDLPTYTIAEVKEHDVPENRMWVTWKGGVYDVTDFICGHPGGSDRLAMVGGTDMAPYWDVYRMHLQPEVFSFLERFRIGNLTPDDAIKMELELNFPDPYIDDPPRPNKDLLHTLERPFCGEPRTSRLGETFYTPNDLHYVRNHLPVPEIDKDEWTVTVSGNGVHERTFTLKDLQRKFKHHEVAVTLQCAGNRREDFDRDDRTVMISPKWRVAAISNAKYKGVYLRDVLEECGLKVDQLHKSEKPVLGQKHVHFESYDCTETGNEYGVSIPIEKAVDPRGDVMLVWEMNGEPLPPDHGYPVRSLTPGMVGNKSAKFLQRIVVSDDISKKPWHLKAYRNFPPNVTFEDHLSKWDTLSADFLSKGPICYMMPVQSLVANPEPSTVVGTHKTAETVRVQGVAWTGNGVGMARVDVSIDGGKTWTAADFQAKPKDVVEREGHNRIWSWSVFEKDVPLTDEMKARLRKGQKVELDVVSKGVDNAFNVQPESVAPYYNARGVVVNEWYHVPVALDPTKPAGTVQQAKGEDAFNPPTGGHFKKPWRAHGWEHEAAAWHAELKEKYGKN
eukprot:Sspe_Gene.102289::Locus_77270_Transcript_2_3_Confidence_0.429_Length_2013::g.102289::m.102289/K00387/SUOX; sulfite oxidase